METPTIEEFTAGYLAFQQREKRDSIYRVATFLIEYFWGQPAEMADSLGVLLLTWNQAFYRYGPFDYDVLEECLQRHMKPLESFRRRDVLSHSSQDALAVTQLFESFRGALQIVEGKKAGAKSPVSAAKALHLLAPGYFPLWDEAIAIAYQCRYADKPAEKYLRFLEISRDMISILSIDAHENQSGKTMLKLIDEYNYARYTKGWI